MGIFGSRKLTEVNSFVRGRTIGSPVAWIMLLCCALVLACHSICRTLVWGLEHGSTGHGDVQLVNIGPALVLVFDQFGP